MGGNVSSDREGFSSSSTRDDPSRVQALAVAWMNAGHAAMVSGERDRLVGAIRAYQEAILLLRPIASSSPAAAHSLGAALMNCGCLLHRVHGTAGSATALAALAEAESLLRALAADNLPWPRRNLAGTLLNRSCLRLDLGHFAEALGDAGRALELVAGHERADAVDAELGLKARRAICDCLGRQIVGAGLHQRELADAASDHVDAGLALFHHWNLPQLQPAAERLFRFGARLCRVHQPHFLAEFLLEHAGARVPGFRAIALENIDAALQAPLPIPRLVIGEPASEREIQAWRDLKAARSRLAPAA